MYWKICALFGIHCLVGASLLTGFYWKIFFFNYLVNKTPVYNTMRYKHQLISDGTIFVFVLFYHHKCIFIHLSICRLSANIVGKIIIIAENFCRPFSKKFFRCIINKLGVQYQNNAIFNHMRIYARRWNHGKRLRKASHYRPFTMDKFPIS